MKTAAASQVFLHYMAQKEQNREIYEGGKKLHFVFTRGNSVAKITSYCKIKLNFWSLQKDYMNVNYGLKNSLSS